MAGDLNIFKTAEDYLGCPKSQIDEIWRAMPGSPYKRLLEYEIDKAIMMRRLQKDPTTPEELQFEKGVREGLAIARGILNRK